MDVFLSSLCDVRCVFVVGLRLHVCRVLFVVCFVLLFVDCCSLCVVCCVLRIGCCLLIKLVD